MDFANQLKNKKNKKNTTSKMIDLTSLKTEKENLYNNNNNHHYDQQQQHNMKGDKENNNNSNHNNTNNTTSDNTTTTNNNNITTTDKHPSVSVYNHHPLHFRYNEGCTNAVRRPIQVKHFLPL